MSSYLDPLLRAAGAPGPAGPAGPPGPPGEDGERGEDGAPGSLIASGYSTPMYFPPAVAGAIDTEFNSDPGFLYYDGLGLAARTPSGTPDIFSTLTPSTANPRLDVNVRKSWARVQTPTSAMGLYYYPTIQTPSLPCWYWTRIGGKISEQGIPGTTTCLALFNNNSGVPDRANNVRVGYSYNANGNGAILACMVGRASDIETVVGNTTAVDAANAVFAPFEYFGFYKTSSGVIGFAWNEAGMWKCFGSISHSLTTFWVGFYLRNSDGADNAWAIHEIDFLRQLNGSTPPWDR